MTLGHMDQLPPSHINAYRPDDQIMERVQAAYKKYDTGDEDRYSVDGRLRSVFIFNELDKKVDYGTIKLAYAFLDI